MTADARLIADRYRLEQQIGAGAMGVVWRAHDIRLDRTVAVKQLLMQPGLGEAETEAARARAMREGRIAARLQHPHAISVYDVALDDIEGDAAGGWAVPWLVMEYLPARSLATILTERGTLPPRDVAEIGRQIAAALAAAHRAGIVHRDVKPSNVLLGADGVVKITDFGISRASWDVAVTRTGVVAGTPAYFAPEVARGEPHDTAADVFSLGATLYAAVEGEPPFGLDNNTLALLRTVAEGQIRSPKQAGPLTTLLMTMLRADPAQRPSMPDAVVALGAVAHGSDGSRAIRHPPSAPTPTAVDLPVMPAQPRSAQQARPRARTAAAAQRAGTDRTPRSRGRAVLLGTSACLLVVLLAVPALTTQRGPDRQAVDTPGAPAATTSPPPAVTPSPPAPPPPAPPPPAPPGPAELEQTVRSYYRLLPEDTTAAWEFLGEAERAKAGFSEYVDFWNGIDDVRIRGAVQVQDNVVLVNLQFDPRERRRTLERYRLTMSTAPDGRVLIESASMIGSVAAHENRGGRGEQADHHDDKGDGDGGGGDGDGSDDSDGSGGGDDG